MNSRGAVVVAGLQTRGLNPKSTHTKTTSNVKTLNSKTNVPNLGSQSLIAGRWPLLYTKQPFGALLTNWARPLFMPLFNRSLQITVAMANALQ